MSIKYTSTRLGASGPYRAPPPPQNCRGWVHFFRVGVKYSQKIKCPQRKACDFRSYSGQKTQKRVFSTYSL